LKNVDDELGMVRLDNFSKTVDPKLVSFALESKLSRRVPDAKMTPEVNTINHC
jgi:hypothetical protein